MRLSNLTADNSTSWSYFIFKTIANPSYQSQQDFTINSYNYLNDLDQLILTYSQETALDYELAPPASQAHHTAASLTDNDILFPTDYTLAYRLDSDLITNQTVLYVGVPVPHMLDSLSLNATTHVCGVTISGFWRK